MAHYDAFCPTMFVRRPSIPELGCVHAHHDVREGHGPDGDDHSKVRNVLPALKLLSNFFKCFKIFKLYFVANRTRCSFSFIVRKLCVKGRIVPIS